MNPNCSEVPLSSVLLRRRLLGAAAALLAAPALANPPKTKAHAAPAGKAAAGKGKAAPVRGGRAAAPVASSAPAPRVVQREPALVPRLTSAAPERPHYLDASALMRADISEAVWRGAPHPATVGVKLIAPELFDQEPVHELDGLSLDRLDVECTRYQPAPDLLKAQFDEAPVTEVLTSNLLKSNCLVTGQPDWGSVRISYSGPQIDQGGLLRYLVSFRNHNEFHEQCVERMFMDIWTRCKPVKLTVYARYTRRGGLDINPYRASHADRPWPENLRTARQ